MACAQDNCTWPILLRIFLLILLLLLLLLLVYGLEDVGCAFRIEVPGISHDWQTATSTSFHISLAF